MSLSRHTAYNIVGQVVPPALSLLLVPTYYSLVGEARFGVLALLWLFAGYLGLFELGLGQAIAFRLARNSHLTQSKQAHSLWTAIMLCIGLGLIGAMLGVALSHGVFGQVNAINTSLRGELFAAMPWLLVLVPVVTVSSVMTGALQARGAFAEINVIAVATSALVLLAPLSAAMAGSTELPTQVASVAAARLLSAAILFARCRQHYAMSSVPTFDQQAARDLFNFGKWATVSACVGPLMVGLDRFFIGAYVGIQAVGQYAMPFLLAERVTTLSSALNYALFPRLAASTNESERARLSEFSLRFVATVISPIVAIALLAVQPFLGWWLTPELAANVGAAARILFVAFWANSLALVAHNKLVASGRTDVIAKTHVVELVPYLAGLYLAVVTWGITGAAVVFLLRVLVDMVALAGLARLLHGLLRHLCWPLLGLTLELLALHPHAMNDFWWLAAATGLVVTAVWSLLAARDLRHDLATASTKVFRA